MLQHEPGNLAVSVHVALAGRYLAEGRREPAEQCLADMEGVPGGLPLLELERRITTFWARRLAGEDVRAAEVEAEMESLAVHPDSRLGSLWAAAIGSP
ncbi:MAG: hypothetical protein AAF602_00105 [Myxococcota bacterium]